MLAPGCVFTRAKSCAPWHQQVELGATMLAAVIRELEIREKSCQTWRTRFRLDHLAPARLCLIGRMFGPKSWLARARWRNLGSPR